LSILDEIDEWASTYEVSLLLVGGSDEERELYAPAILGISDGYWNDDRIAIVYDADKMIDIIAGTMEPSGDPDDPNDEYNDPYFLAQEHFEFNIKGGWHGEHTPIFINTLGENINEHNSE